MKNLLKQLWNDDRGIVISSELIMVVVLVVIGTIVGLATFRDSLVQELGDTGAAVGQVNQSYSVGIGDSANTNPADGVVIADSNGAAPGGTVTVTRHFQQNGATVVAVTATFENYFYTDQPEKGDGQDVAGSPPAGIVVAGAGAPSTAGENSIPNVIP